MQALPILMYHHVSPNPGLVTVSPGVFRAQIERLARQGWRSINTAQLEAFYAGQPLPAKSLMITFDDGYLDNFVHAHPVLAEFGMQAVNFVVTGWMGEGPVRTGVQDCPDHNECKRRVGAGEMDSVILRWSEAELMQAAGTFEFHAHTHTHTRWDQKLPDHASRCASMADDLARCQAVFRQRLGGSRHLCWPQGYFHPDYLPLARDAGFDYLYTTKPLVNPLGGDPSHIGRIVTRERAGSWVSQRASIYASSHVAKAYNYFKGLA